MGATTYWFGSVQVDPPLDAAAVELLERLGDGDALPGAEHLGRCGWTASPDRTAIVWDGGEKFNDGAAWLRLLLDRELRGHAAHGTVFGFCSPEADLVDACRLTVADGDVAERVYDIPVVEVPEELDDEVSVDDAFYAMSGLDGAAPDYEEAARALDALLSAVPLSELGELELFLSQLLDALGRPQPLTATFDSRR